MKTRNALFLLLPALLLAQSNGSRQPAPLVLAHVTVIDVAGGPSKPDMTVVIREDRISDIGKAGEMPPAAGRNGRGCVRQVLNSRSLGHARALVPGGTR